MKSFKRLGAGNVAHYHGPDNDPLFYACFHCPYDDCKYDQSNLGECLFRVEWGRNHMHEELQKTDSVSLSSMSSHKV
jgi:hypothetical protein